MKKLEMVEKLSQQLLAQPNYAFAPDCVTPEDRSAAVRHRAILQDYQSRCPDEFRTPFDPALIDDVRPWEEAWPWIPGTYPGLWIYSEETGRSKTRFAWLKYGQASFCYRLTPSFLTGVRLSDLYHETRWDGKPAQFQKFFERRDFVILDDLDKFLLTDDKHALAIRELFDLFYREHMSVLVTANVSPEYFRGELGNSAYRRLVEACRVVCF